MTYAGLTTADKGALESYLSKGIERCPLMLNGELQIVDAHEALAQIAEMEKAQKPSGCGWCNGVTRMSGTFWTDKDENCGGTFGFEFCPNCGRSLNSPYTEGATDEG